MKELTDKEYGYLRIHLFPAEQRGRAAPGTPAYDEAMQLRASLAERGLIIPVQLPDLTTADITPLGKLAYELQKALKSTK